MLGFHYRNKYFELTDEEYDNMITEIKNMENVIFINNPYILIDEIKIFIRSDVKYYSVILLKTDKEKLNDEINLLKNISKEIENEKYICYKRITKKNIIQWIKTCA
jgi:hypothetical protein